MPFKIKYKGQVYDMPWDKEEPPTREEALVWAKTLDKDYVPPMPTLPSPDTTPGPIPDPRTLENRTLSDKAKSYALGASDLFTGMADSVNKSAKAAKQHISEGQYPAAFHDIAAPVVDPFMGTIRALSSPSQFKEENVSPDASVNRMQAISGVTGIPTEDIATAWKSGDYPRLAGQATTVLGMLAAPKMFKGRETRAPKMERPNDLPPPTPPIAEGPIDLPPPSPRGLPPVTEGFTGNEVYPTSTLDLQAKPTRFYQGRAGTVDVTNRVPTDIGPNPDNLSGTVLPREFEGLTLPPPESVAEFGNTVGLPRDYASEIATRRNSLQDLEDWRTAQDRLLKNVDPNTGEVVLPNPNDVPAPETIIPEAVKERIPPPTKAPSPGELRMSELVAKFGGRKAEPEPRDVTRDLPSPNVVNKPPVDPNAPRPYKSQVALEDPNAQVAAIRDQIAARKAQAKTVADNITKKNIPTDAPTIAAAVESEVPEIQTAAKQAVRQAVVKNSFVKRSGIKGVAQDLGMGTLEKIRRMGPAGQEIYRIVSKSRLDAEAMAGDRTVRANDIVKDFVKDPERFEIFRRALDTGEVPVDPDIRAAVEKFKGIDAEIVGAAKQHGVSLRTAEGKRIPFQGRENYWPHIMPKEFFQNRQSALESLMKLKKPDGKFYSPEEASKILKNAYQFGERLISPQHGRQVEGLEGYRTDWNAMLQHIHDMSRRTVEARELGPMDLADKSKGLGKLVSETSDPVWVNKELSKYLGREEPSNPDLSRFVKTTLKAEAFMHLSQFAISNLNNLATIPMRANSLEFVRGLYKAFTKNGKIDAEKSGALQTIHQEALREAGGEGLLSKAFLMHKSEGFNRAVASISGQGTARALFERIKNGEGSAHDKARLSDLLLEPAESIEKQGELTPEQIRRAGGRMAEITQGRAQSIDLPKIWSDYPAMDLIFLFKKYAFRQSKVVKDALTTGSPAQRAKAGAIALGLLQVSGELTGDVKAGIRGAVKGSPDEEIQQRGSEYQKLLGDNSVVNRVVANYMQAWALGLVGDALQASLQGNDSMLKFLVGPVGQDTADFVGGAGQAATGNPAPLGKKVVRSVPLVGPGLADQMGKTNKHRTLPALPRLQRHVNLPRP